MKAKMSAVLWTVLSVAHAGPQVTGNAACPVYAVDMAAFATCDGDRVAAFDQGVVGPALLPESAVPLSKRTFSGLYVDAVNAHRLKNDNRSRVVLIDVRSRVEIGLTGQPISVDVHVPLLETTLPLRWDGELGGWAMTSNVSFAAEVMQRLVQLGADRDTPLLLLCRAGDRSARAADELAASGYTQTITVVDGFEGDVGADGARSVNGWKNAGLPWIALLNAAPVNGAGDRVAGFAHQR